MTYYELFQLERYGDILPEVSPQEDENNFYNSEQVEIKADQIAELTLIKLQY